jgi:hypothetical protein
MSKLNEEYYHKNMYSWEELVSECIGLEDTVTQLRSENERLTGQLVEAETLLTEYIARYGEFYKE